ncbi:MAG: 1-acyl-sn-glycerol-3-phosphate acyltransferase [Bacteroidota bacterium]|nr:1-acyl-sn-glycerol-3-phosphate acyltransferase [Bacteroidota bacterium]
MLRKIAQIILQFAGWDTNVSFPQEIRKCIIVVGPHTSSWDFVIGALYRKVLHLEEVKFLGKRELFKFPLGIFFRWLGGIPVNRYSHSNVVAQVTDWFSAKEDFRIALSPEGTRKRVNTLKTGFYYIAKEAGVPIVMVGIDFSKKKIFISPPFFISESVEKDVLHIIKFFSLMNGKNSSKDLSHLRQLF